MRRILTSTLLAVACALGTAALSGCEDWGEITTATDFNTLIPRFLNEMDKKTPEEVAGNLFNVTSADERREAIAYLEVQPYGHNDAEMRAYRLLTIDPHPMVRAQAMRALGSSNQDSAVEDLIKGLALPKAPDGPSLEARARYDAQVRAEAVVRRDAATGLMTTWGEAATIPLTDTVRNDPDDQTRINAARALARATTKEAIAALIAAINDRKDSAVCYFALESLQTITRQDYGYDSRAWTAWYQKTYNPPATTATAPAQ